MLVAGLIVAQPGATSAEKIALTGGKVVTVSRAGTLEGATVLIDGGMITAVGPDVAVPAGYRVIDASGRWVTPGLMQADSRLGVEEVELEASTTDYQVNTGGTGESAIAPFFAAFDLSYGINPNTPLIEIERIEGLTRAAVLPAPGRSVFAGQGALIHLGDGMDIVTRPRAAMVAYIGETGADATGGARGAAMVYLRAALREAERFARDGDAALPRRERDSILPRLDAEALGPVVEGETPLILGASRASDILQVIALKKDFPHLRPVVLGADEGWMVADQMAAASVPAIVDPLQNLPVTFSQLGATLANAGRMSRKGVVVAIVGGGGEIGPGNARTHNARLLTQAAGVAVAHGMDWDAALSAITLNPARIFGIDDDVGTLEPGKDADVVVWDGDPLELMSSPTAVIVRGEPVPLVSRQTRLRDRYLHLDGGVRPAYRR